MATGYRYQIASVLGDWYVRKINGAHTYYFAGYDAKGRVMWSRFFNFTLAMSFDRAIKVCDEIRGRRA